MRLRICALSLQRLTSSRGNQGVVRLFTSFPLLRSPKASLWQVNHNVPDPCAICSRRAVFSALRVFALSGKSLTMFTIVFVLAMAPFAGNVVCTTFQDRGHKLRLTLTVQISILHPRHPSCLWVPAALACPWTLLTLPSSEHNLTRIMICELRRALYLLQRRVYQ